MKLSVIICTYNRADLLPDAINSLAQQNLNHADYEVVVVNNNSTDTTDQVCRKFAFENPDINFRYFIELRQGLSIARNRGINESTGELVAFIDDDATADPDYARNILSAFGSYSDYDTMGGKVLPVYPENNEPDWMSKYIEGVVSKVDYGENFSEFYSKKYPVGCNMIFRRSLFSLIGLFNEDLKFRSDDKYIFLKVREHGKRILYAPDIVVHHVIDKTRLNYGFIKKLCIQIGGTERVRLKSSISGLTAKFIEYLWKMTAAIIIALNFLAKGQKEKAVYLIKVRWFILTGFFKTVRYIKQK